MKRNWQLAVRTRQGLVREQRVAPEAVSRIFYIFESAMDKIHHSQSRLYNCDETGITVVQHKHTNVVGLKGKRQIAALQAAERGVLITIMTCMSLVGHFVPPLVIFRRTNVLLELIHDCLLGPFMLATRLTGCRRTYLQFRFVTSSPV
jgi:hypothetical protein